MGPTKSVVRRIVDADPVVVRGAIVSVFGFVASILNFKLADGIQEGVISAVIGVLALVSAVWSRGKVTPNVKVVSYMPSPDTHPELVLPSTANSSVVSVKDVQP